MESILNPLRMLFNKLPASLHHFFHRPASFDGCPVQYHSELQKVQMGIVQTGNHCPALTVVNVAVVTPAAAYFFLCSDAGNHPVLHHQCLRIGSFFHIDFSVDYCLLHV